MSRYGFINMVCLFLVWNMGSAAVLKDIDIKTQHEKTVVTFSLSEPFDYKAFTLSNPSRVVVDLYHTTTSINAGSLPKGQSFIKHIRIGHPKTGLFRVVFDLDSLASISTKKSAQRLEIMLKSRKAAFDTKPGGHASQSPVMVSSPSVKSLRDVVVVIDPGHGGKDPGAIGPTRHLEKNVVLAIALKLKKIIDKEPGMRAVLTRSGDYYVGLRKRLDIAREQDGDIFISIHADAFKNKKSNGASVFALSQTGATSEAARWLAEKENYSELGGVNLSELNDQNGVIRSVLIDLSQTATIGASVQMGERVLRAIDGMTNLHNKNIEQARFVVLKSPDIPSILVETGFISNPREEKNLTNAAYQTKLAKAIVKGVKAHFYEHPVHGSRIEAMIATNRHVVSKGETLSGIAAAYSTSITKLKELNHLTSDRLHIGQSLSVPKRWS